MRANVGIRRRLAPLLGNSRAEIELSHALLLSLPGSPCLYYGDEIGMGDNIWLPDRDAVRTPMQWTPDRNAGFSTADPGKLYLPVVQSLVNHYAAVNVEAQIAQKTSLLHWVRGILDVRRQHAVFGDGDFVPLRVDNDAVLAFTRSNGHETVLCVMNMANTARSTTVRLPDHAGHHLTDVFGGARFPAVSADGTVTFTLGSRDFFWLVVTRPEEAVAAPMGGLPAHVRPAPAEGEGEEHHRPETYHVNPDATGPRAPVLPPHGEHRPPTPPAGMPVLTAPAAGPGATEVPSSPDRQAVGLDPAPAAPRVSDPSAATPEGTA